MALLGLQRLFILIPYLGALLWCLCVERFFSHGTANLPRPSDSEGIGKLRRGWWLENHTSTIDEQWQEAFCFTANGIALLASKQELGVSHGPTQSVLHNGTIAKH